MKKENSTNSLNQKAINATCGTAATLTVISGRWKVNILWYLLEGKKRYSELRDKLPGISERILVMKLKEMEADGLISRTVYPEVPPRVEYEMTELGMSLERMLRAIDDWGNDYRKKII